MASVSISITESVFDTLRFERAFITVANGALAPRVVVSGVLCILGDKETLLEAGLAFCQPEDPSLAEHWPVYTDAIVDGQPMRLWCVTNQPDVVRAARRFHSLCLAGELREGMSL